MRRRSSSAKPPTLCSCGRAVSVDPSYGGNPGSMTFYRVQCPCGRDEDDLGKDGTKRGATAMWNRLRRDEQRKARAN